LVIVISDLCIVCDLGFVYWDFDYQHVFPIAQYTIYDIRHTQCEKSDSALSAVEQKRGLI